MIGSSQADEDLVLIEKSHEQHGQRQCDQGDHEASEAGAEKCIEERANPATGESRRDALEVD